MITFTYLDKTQKEHWLPQLFDIFYDNMHCIAPSNLSYEQEKQRWLSQVSPALEKEPRKILLCLDSDGLAGFVQFYTNKNLLMIEEIQIKKPYQRTTLFYGLCKHLAIMLPEGIEVVEAYAEKRNLHSQKIMEKLDMVQIEEDGPFVHLRGSVQNVKRFFK